MPPFIDIHTHRSPLSDPSYWVVTNFSQTNFTADREKLGDTEGRQLRSVGLHPYYLTKENAKSDFETLTQLIENQQVVAVGECGLDRLRGEDLAFQTVVFEQQIRLAESVNKPVVVHCVRAFSELISVQKRLRPRVPLVVHGFVKNEKLLHELLAVGFYISIGAAILRGGIDFKKMVQAIPKDRLFLETDDAADSIEAVYEAVAEARSVSLTDLKSKIYENFCQVFRQKQTTF